MNFARLNTMYWTKELCNTSKDGTIINADISETFTSNLVEQANDWVVAVERFELSTNAIPYYDGGFNNENIRVYNLADDIEVAVPVQTIALNNVKGYSLQDTLKQVVEQMGGNGVPSGDGNFNLTMDREGFVSFTRTNQATYKVVFPQKLTQVLGLTGDDPNTATWRSVYPRVSCGDELGHIRISSNLNIISDTVGQAKTNIITDLSVPSSISASSEAEDAFSWSPRDKIIYTPSEKRYLNFNSSAPIQVIRVFVEYIQPDGTSRLVTLPVGGVFNIKLGFYQRI
jgi:hypothetical protein